MTTQQNEDEEDLWDAFGEDEDSQTNTTSQDDGNSLHHELVEAGVLFLTQQFLRQRLSRRRVSVVLSSRTAADREQWIERLQQRGIVATSPDELCDAAILNQDATDEESRRARRNVVAGGLLLLLMEDPSGDVVQIQEQLSEGVWNIHQVKLLYSSPQPHHQLMALQKHACPINERSCPWKPPTPNEERRLLEGATVTRSAHEIIHRLPLTDHQLQHASQCLTTHGYCVVRSLLDRDQCCTWGKAVLDDFDQACQLLQGQEGVDLRHPQSSQSEPQNYREMAMREDLRMDLRDGPRLRQLRNEESTHYDEWNVPKTTGDVKRNSPVVTTSSGSHDSCLRFHTDILEIIRRTMNPKDATLYRGNLGRFNFDGSGPDGSFPPLRIGPMGGIVSLPGSADQALHADTPHLFEHMDCLPAHYVNVFALGADAGVETDADGSPMGSTDVGGTAFVHGSHHLSFTAEVANNQDDSSLLSESGRAVMLRQLVRPSLEVGDVVFFDCRILHFGLANNSKDNERPMLYINTTHAWFHDPKNWDDRKSIFD